MRPHLAHRHPAPAGGYVESSREGRDCEASRRVSLQLLFPRLDARPGPWLLLLVAACSYVAIRALEMGPF